MTSRTVSTSAQMGSMTTEIYPSAPPGKGTGWARPFPYPPAFYPPAILEEPQRSAPAFRCLRGFCPELLKKYASLLCLGCKRNLEPVVKFLPIDHFVA